MRGEAGAAVLFCRLWSSFEHNAVKCFSECANNSCSPTHATSETHYLVLLLLLLLLLRSLLLLQAASPGGCE
jgi:hypothetical protein